MNQQSKEILSLQGRIGKLQNEVRPTVIYMYNNLLLAIFSWIRFTGVKFSDFLDFFAWEISETIDGY